MTIEYLLAFNGVLFAAIASPRPALLIALQTTLEVDRNAGIAVSLGIRCKPLAATETIRPSRRPSNPKVTALPSR